MGDLVICEKSFPVLFDKDGVEHVTLRDLCEPFGLDQGSQGVRLKKSGWAKVAIITTFRSGGKRYPVPCLPLKSVPMFFASLEPARVNAGFRSALITMQSESTDALYNYYARGGAIRREAPLRQLLELQKILEEFIRDVPAVDFIWPPALMKRYEAWHGRPWKAGDRPPFSMKAANGFFWRMVFPPAVLAVLREKGLEEACRFHQVLTDEPRGYVRRCLDVATKLAEDSSTEVEWRARMRRWFGKTKSLLAGQSELGL